MSEHFYRGKKVEEVDYAEGSFSGRLFTPGRGVTASGSVISGVTPVSVTVVDATHILAALVTLGLCTDDH